RVATQTPTQAEARGGNVCAYCHPKCQSPTADGEAPATPPRHAAAKEANASCRGSPHARRRTGGAGRPHAGGEARRGHSGGTDTHARCAIRAPPTRTGCAQQCTWYADRATLQRSSVTLSLLFRSRAALHYLTRGPQPLRDSAPRPQAVTHN